LWVAADAGFYSHVTVIVTAVQHAAAAAVPQTHTPARMNRISRQGMQLASERIDKP
jgi:hypothetical protein